MCKLKEKERGEETTREDERGGKAERGALIAAHGQTHGLDGFDGDQESEAVPSYVSRRTGLIGRRRRTELN